jgi:hypothetical protein|tara:strand:+ start:451 stop:576 length:126 start_codon:yes stop_codon:yes gene_type:complete
MWEHNPIEISIKTNNSTLIISSSVDFVLEALLLPTKIGLQK